MTHLKLVNKQVADLINLSCTLFPGKFRHGETVPTLYNKIYSDWIEVWTDVLTKSGNPGALNLDNFFRQDILIALHLGNKLVGVVTSTFFNLNARATFDHPYLHPFPKSLVQGLKAEGIGLAITGEYLTVQPEFRKKIIGFSMADVLVGLLMKILFQVDAKAALATTIREAKTHVVCKNFGYTQVSEQKKYGLDCILLCNTKSQYREHSSPIINTMVNQLWGNRKDLTGLTVANENKSIEKAS